MRFLPLLFVLATCPILAAYGQTVGPIAKEAGFSCGLNAAYIFLNRAGHHVAYEQLVGEFRKEQPPDSLLAIKNVLALHGCPTVGIKAGAEYLLGIEEPAIVYLQLNGYSLNGETHFSYMVHASKKNGVELLDPIFEVNSPSFMTWDTFTRIYKGTALIVHE